MNTATRAPTTRKNADQTAADVQMAQSLNKANKPNIVEPGAPWEARHVAKYRGDHNLTWHHHENVNTRSWETDMQLVKDPINRFFNHTSARGLVDQHFALDRSQ
jgi:hypothetical protein